MEKNFDGKVALVTGAGSGIGQATARLFAERGANVVITDLNQKGAADTEAMVRKAGTEALIVIADLSDPHVCENIVNKTVERFNRLDIAFNNAGIGGEMQMVADMSIEGWLKVINVNLNSVFFCMKYQIAQMLKQGKGAIVNMSSILGSVAFANAAGYVAAKHGVVGLTQTAAVEYAQKGIRINAVGPGFIRTPLLSAMDEHALKAITNLHPIGRLGESNEVAELVLWLASDQASFITGSYYPVDGGYLAL